MPFVNVNSVQVNFPFEPYNCQLDYMGKVVECLRQGMNGILESPTGTGKTLCLLCSSLAWLEDKKAQISSNRWKMASSEPDPHDLNAYKNELAKQIDSAAGAWSGEIAPPKIIYASRTHSQLSQAIQELKRTAYSHFKVCVLGSREQLCIHPQVMKEESNTSKVHLCRAKVNARTCFFYNNVENAKSNFTAQVMDIEDLVTQGKKHNCCPYYAARELKAEADIIFMPYNYLLDPKSRKAHGVELQGNIVIFDEAHNLEKICEDSASFDWSSSELASAMRELTDMSEKVQEWNNSEQEIGESPNDSQVIGQDFTLKDLLTVKMVLMSLEEQIDAVSIPKAEGITKPGNFIFEIFDKAHLNFESKNSLIDVIDKVVTYLTSEATSMLSSRGAGLSKFSDIIKIVFSRQPDEFANMQSHKNAVSKHYRVHVQENKNTGKGKKSDGWGSVSKSAKVGRTLSYWCFSPGHAMEDLRDHGVRSIILTSGTLSPMSSFKTEMGIDFKVELENPHVIEKHQIWIGMMGKGPDGTLLSSAYENRSKPEYLSSLGNGIVNYARIVPNGMLLFFPSYPVMDKCIEHWQNSNIWSRIEQHKSIFVEPRFKAEFQTAMENFYEKINDPTLNGAIFAAVCRGKVSEGLDFSDINGRAVIITGLPFPPRMDPKVILKMLYLDESKRGGGNGLTGQQWYRQQASRAVNQAIGRVIRHKQDYGAIILCDNRFNSNESKSQLPSWVRPYATGYDFGQGIRDLMYFFKNAEKTMPQFVPKPKRQPAPGAGCQGARFQMSLSRRGQMRMENLEKASTVTQHVPSLTKRDEMSMTALAARYKQCGPINSAKTKPKGLLDALCHTEKTSKTDISEETPFTCQDAQTKTKTLPSQVSRQKKKIVLKKSSSSTITKEKLQTAEQYLAQVKKTLSTASYGIFSKSLCEYKKSGDLAAMVTILSNIFLDNAENHNLFKSFYRFVRPHHKLEFDQTCKNLLGEGCGYKPSDGVSKKRPMEMSKSSDEKRQKIETKDMKPKTKSAFTLSELNNGKTAKSESLASASTSKASDSKPASCSSSESTSGNIETTKMSNTASSSSISKENTGGAAKSNEPAAEYRGRTSSGYTCCKCKEDAHVPLKAHCGHICCIDCWKSAIRDTKVCPECRVQVKRKQLARIYFQSGPNFS